MRYYFIRQYSRLEEFLESHYTESLGRLAKLFVAKPPASKEGRIRVIMNALESDGLRRVYDVMKPIEKAAIAETVYDREGRFLPLMFRAKYGELPKINFDRYSRIYDDEPGSVLDIFLPDLMMPRDVRERFTAFVPPPEPYRLQTTAKLPETILTKFPDKRQLVPVPLTVHSTERAAIHDLTAVLRLIDAGKVAASPTTGRVNIAGIRAILPHLLKGDFAPDAKIGRATDAIRAFAWPLLVVDGGFAEPKDNKLALTDAGHEALVTLPEEVLLSLWNHWIQDGTCDEFARIDQIKGVSSSHDSDQVAVLRSRREVALRALSFCPEGDWIAVDELRRFIQATGIALLTERPWWNLEIAGYPLEAGNVDDCELMDILQGRYLMCLLLEYAATLGLVDVACVPTDYARADFLFHPMHEEIPALSRYDGLIYFRINALGAYCLGRRESYVTVQPQGLPLLKVLPNHEIVVTEQDAFQTADAIFLDRICTKVNQSTWKLDKQRILNAMHEGFRPKQIQEFLSAKSGTKLPANVRRWIDDTIDAATRISDGGAAHLFETEDAGTALQVLHAKALSALCYSAGDTRIVVPTEHLAAFKRELKKMGYVLQPRKHDR